jgi:hypothetical protein
MKTRDRGASDGEELFAIVVQRPASGRGWLESLRHLLQGKRVRREIPEQVAADQAVEGLRRRAERSGVSSLEQPSLSVSTERRGRRRIVTAVLTARSGGGQRSG